MASIKMSASGTSSHHHRGRAGRVGGSGGAQLRGPGGTLAGDVFTFVVSLVVVTGSIVAIGRLALNDNHQSATKRSVSPRADRPRTPRPPRPARALRRPAVA